MNFSWSDPDPSDLHLRIRNPEALRAQLLSLTITRERARLGNSDFRTGTGVPNAVRRELGHRIVETFLHN